MEYRRLGSRGLKISDICVGTMTFGLGTKNTGEPERMVFDAVDAGVTLFDNAGDYSDGVSEAMLGWVLGVRRRERVIAT